MLYPKNSQQELEDEAFHHTMYRDEIQDRPLGYGLGVKKGNIYGVRGFLRKKGCGKVQRRINLMDNVKEEVTALHEKNDTLEKENEKLKDKVEQNNLLLKTLVGQFSNIVDAVRQGNASPNLLNKKSHILGMANQQVGKGNLMNTGE